MGCPLVKSVVKNYAWFHKVCVVYACILADQWRPDRGGRRAVAPLRFLQRGGRQSCALSCLIHHFRLIEILYIPTERMCFQLRKYSFSTIQVEWY